MKNNSFLVWMLGLPVSTGLFIYMSGTSAGSPIIVGLIFLWIGVGISMYEGAATTAKSVSRARSAAKTKKAKKR